MEKDQLIADTLKKLNGCGWDDPWLDPDHAKAVLEAFAAALLETKEACGCKYISSRVVRAERLRILAALKRAEDNAGDDVSPDYYAGIGVAESIVKGKAAGL